MRHNKIEAYKLIQKYYEWESHVEDSYLEMYSSHNILEQYEHQQRYKKMVREVRECQGKMDIVADIGCAEGYYFKDYAKRFKILIGLDISFNKLKRARALMKLNSSESHLFTRTHLICSNAETLPLASNSTNLVVCSELLEHLIEPELAIHEIERVLKLQSVAIISIPTWNNRRLWGKRKKNKRKININFERAFEGHLWRFSTHSFLRLVRKSNLKLMKVRGISPVQFSFIKKGNIYSVPVFWLLFWIKKLMDKVLDLWPKAYIYCRYNIFVLKKEMSQ